MVRAQYISTSKADKLVKVVLQLVTRSSRPIVHKFMLVSSFLSQNKKANAVEYLARPANSSNSRTRSKSSKHYDIQG